MHNRFPQARELANSSSSMAFVLRSGNNVRTYEVNPWLAGTGAIVLTVLAIWYLFATTYLVFRDDVLKSLLSGQTRNQYAYEDRIAQLRVQIDRVSSRQLLDQDTVENKLHELISRQVQLETRQTMIARLADDAGRQGFAVGAATAAARPAPPTPPAPLNGFNALMPVQAGTMVTPAAPSQRQKPTPEGSNFRAPEPIEELRFNKLSEVQPISPRALPIILDQASATAQLLGAKQAMSLQTIEKIARSANQRYRDVFSRTGLDQQRFAKLMTAQAKNDAIGGPLVSIKGDGAFERAFLNTKNILRDTEQLGNVVNALPVRRPLPREYETTSVFGARVDPFTRGYAMHTGLDFRATTGTSVRATAPGRIIQAGWVGGYGRLVEIDHGNGLTTRFGHLSAIDVVEGELVKRGAVVGQVGTTGRSTGPHLHYEVRIDDEAVDPMRFVRAGEQSGIN